eukprot:TRINITY_DN953_c1_g1_i2.p1 TRINITY_DN953_c1_g1~~TRINITY_DN953_c1_g1_i2.p1  ORF type:complete len:422 (-),score=8.54 TRINITY_DN953_c1_g1_i2:73-1338(-)
MIDLEMKASAKDQLIAMIMEINGGDVTFQEDQDSASRFNRVGRREGEVGVSEGAQRILSCTVTNKECRAIMLQITYLAAGFIVGYKGDSIKQIWSKTGASIRSTLMENKEEGESTTRLFHISGSCFQILRTLKIFQAAVNRYKDLVDGQKADIIVDSKQVIQGIVFQYCPPPIDASPHAARTMKFIKDTTTKTILHRSSELHYATRGNNKQSGASTPSQQLSQSPTHSSSWTGTEYEVINPEMTKYGMYRTETQSPQCSLSSDWYVSPPSSFPAYGLCVSPSQSFSSLDQYVSPAPHVVPHTVSNKLQKTPNFDTIQTPKQAHTSYLNAHSQCQHPFDYNHHEQQYQVQQIMNHQVVQTPTTIGYGEYQYQQYFVPSQHQMPGYGVHACDQYGNPYRYALYPVAQNASNLIDVSAPYFAAQ